MNIKVVKPLTFLFIYFLLENRRTTPVFSLQQVSSGWMWAKSNTSPSGDFLFSLQWHDKLAHTWGHSPIYLYPLPAAPLVSVKPPSMHPTAVIGGLSLSLIAMLSAPLLHCHCFQPFQADGHANYCASTRTQTDTRSHMVSWDCTVRVDKQLVQSGQFRMKTVKNINQSFVSLALFTHADKHTQEHKKSQLELPVQVKWFKVHHCNSFPLCQHTQTRSLTHPQFHDFLSLFSQTRTLR